jgi:hypothetical protein
VARVEHAARFDEQQLDLVLRIGFVFDALRDDESPSTTMNVSSVSG